MQLGMLTSMSKFLNSAIEHRRSVFVCDINAMLENDKGKSRLVTHTVYKQPPRFQQQQTVRFLRRPETWIARILNVREIKDTRRPKQH